MGGSGVGGCCYGLVVGGGLCVVVLGDGWCWVVSVRVVVSVVAGGCAAGLGSPRDGNGVTVELL